MKRKSLSLCRRNSEANRARGVWLAGLLTILSLLQCAYGQWIYRVSWADVRAQAGVFSFDRFGTVSTGPGYDLSAGLLALAFGRNVASDWGLSVGTKLARLSLIKSTQDYSSVTFQSLIAVSLGVTKGVSPEREGSEPIFSLSLEAGPVAVAHNGLSPDLGFLVGCDGRVEWNRGLLNPAIELSVARSAEMSARVGVSLGIGTWGTLGAAGP